MKACQQHPAHGTTPGPRIVRLMTALCLHAEADLRRISLNPAQAVHALRLRMKKLRALLFLIRDMIPQAKMQRLRTLIRQIKNAFAGRRDFEVLQKLVAAMRRRHGLSPLRLPAASGRDTAAAAAKALAIARGRTLRLLRAVGALRLEDLTPQDVLAGYVCCQHGCRRHWKKCAAGDDAKHLHRWRKQVKHWYFLSLALGRLPQTRKNVRAARKLGRLLGQVNDLQMLEAHLSDAAAASWQRAIAKEMHRKKARLFAIAARALHLPRRRLQRRLRKEMRRLAGG